MIIGTFPICVYADETKLYANAPTEIVTTESSEEQTAEPVSHNARAYSDETCTHENVDVSTLTCSVCGKNMTAKVMEWNDETNPKWYSDINNAFASVPAGESKMVALRNGTYTLSEDIHVYGVINCDFINPTGSGNAVNFDGGHSFVVNNGGTLLLGQFMRIGAATVEAGGHFSLSPTATVDQLILKENCRILADSNCRLTQGNFGKITVPEGHSVRDMVCLYFSNSELSFRHTDGTWATEQELSSTEIEDVSIAALPFAQPSISLYLNSGAYMDSSDKLEQVYNGNNAATLLISKSSGNITDYKWVVDYYAPDSETVSSLYYNSTAERINGLSLDKPGTYKAKCTVSADGYSRELKASRDIVITKAAPTYTAEPQKKDGLVYTGLPQTLVNAGSADGGKIQYSLNGTDWSDDVPQATLAGKYTVYYKIIGDENHSDSAASSMEVIIAKRPINNPVFDAISKVYDGTANLPTGISVKSFTDTVTDMDMSLSVNDYTITGSYDSAAAGNNKNVSLSVKLTNQNFIFVNGTDTYDLTYPTGSITKAPEPINTTLGNLVIRIRLKKQYTFDVKPLLPELDYGQKTYILTDVDCPDFYDESEGVASINQDGILTFPAESALGMSGSGTVGTIYVTVLTDNYEDIHLTIQIDAQYRMYIDGEPTLSTDTITYGQPLSDITFSGKLRDSSGNEVDGKFSWQEPSAKPEVTEGGNKYSARWIYEPDNPEYETSSGSVYITVLKAQPEYTVSPAPVSGLTYDGAQHSLITPGTSAHGTISYSLDGTNWSSEVPKASDADTYTVYCKITGSKNYTDRITTYENIKIAKRPIEILWKGTENLVYDGNVKTISAELANAAGTDSVKLTINGELTASEAGNYTAEVVGTDNENYTLENGVNLIKQWTVARADNTITDPVIADSTYGDSPVNPSATARFGTPKYSYSSDRDSGYTENVPKKAGTYFVKASVEATKNYTAAESNPVSYVIARKSISDAVVAPDGALTYNGTEQTQNVTVTLDGFTVTYDVSGNTETNVKTDGSYTLTVTGTGNFTGTKQLDWNIAPAAPVENSAKKTTARVARGRKLSVAAVKKGELLGVDGTTVLDGTFTWLDDSRFINANSTEQMTFSPDDGNYRDIIIDVAVSTYSPSTGGSSSSSGTASSVSHTVRFDTNGGSKISDVKVANNGFVKEPTAPVKDGFEFDGWFADAALKNKFDFSSKITKDLTLYAAWTERKTETQPSETPDPKPSDEPEKTDAENPFDDVSKDDWYYNDVISAVKKGLFTGTDGKTFDPNGIITRAMFVTVLYRADGKPEVNKSIPFDDVSADDYYADAVIWAHQNGIVNGVSETEFAPNESITREQIAAILFRFAEYKGYDVTQGGMKIREFDDFESISEYALSAMAWAVNTGLINGKTKTEIAPKDSATRAETAAILNRFSENRADK